MTEVAHAPAADQAEQLPLEFETPETGTTTSVVPVDVMEEIVRSPAYGELVELRDAAYANHRSGARRIARLAFAALQGGSLTKEEYLSLFTADEGEKAQEPDFDELSIERPPREPDHAERAAGEAVRHPWDEEA